MYLFTYEMSKLLLKIWCERFNETHTEDLSFLERWKYSSRTQFSPKYFSISTVFNFITDLDQSPTSEECCGPVTVAKYGRKNEAEEVSLMKACMEFVGQDLSRLEPKPKVNDQERGGSSSEEDFSPGNKDWREYYNSSFLLVHAKRERTRGRLMLRIWSITSNLINWWKGLSLNMAFRDIPKIFLFSFFVFENMQHTNFWFGKKWFFNVNSFDGVECMKSINFWEE